MELREGFLCLGAVCAFVLLVAGWQKKTQVLTKFCLRLVLGAAAICVGNALLERLGIPAAVGLNPISLFASGLLGLPGVAALYGIALL